MLHAGGAKPPKALSTGTTIVGLIYKVRLLEGRDHAKGADNWNLPWGDASWP